MLFLRKGVKPLFFCISITILFSSLICKKEYFLLINSTSVNSNAGIPGEIGGTEYYFKIKVHTDKKLVFDSLWVKNKGGKAFVANKSKVVSNTPVSFTKNDTIMVRVSLLDDNKNTTIHSPLKYKGAALLRFYIDNKTKYYPIKEITNVKASKRQ